MKKLLMKFRLSNALDDGAARPVPDALRQKIGAWPELRDFAQRAAALDRAFRRPPPVHPADPTLHHSIMRAVRATAATSVPRRMPMRLGFATASVALAAIAIWLAARSAAPVLLTAQPDAKVFAAAQTVLDLGSEVSRSVPGAVVAPLSNEWASVDHDIRDTTQFILAAVP